MNNNTTNNEINYIREEMKNNLSTRTTLLTFCFTSVITVLGFGLTHFDEIPFLIYIIPIIITFTFSCRITYYKDKQCRMNAYLKYFHKNSIKYENIYSDKLNIKNFCVDNKICSLFINNELLVLSCVCLLPYYIKLYNSIKCFTNKYILILFIALPLLLCICQLFVLRKVPSYAEKTEYYFNLFKNNIP